MNILTRRLKKLFVQIYVVVYPLVRFYLVGHCFLKNVTRATVLLHLCIMFVLMFPSYDLVVEAHRSNVCLFCKYTNLRYPCYA